MIRIVSDDKNIQILSKEVIQAMMEILGQDGFEKPLTIINDKNSNVPIFIINPDDLQIRLSLEDTSFWSQLIFQLSHEMFHYFLYNKKDDKRVLKWFEETIAEAFSLFMLKYFANNWEKSELYELFPDYDKNLEAYYETILRDKVILYLSISDSLSDLRKIEANSERNRSWRRHSRNEVLKIMEKYPNKIYELGNYTDYINPDEKLILDFGKWFRETDSIFIRQIENVFPKIRVREKIAGQIVMAY